MSTAKETNKAHLLTQHEPITIQVSGESDKRIAYPATFTTSVQLPPTHTSPEMIMSMDINEHYEALDLDLDLEITLDADTEDPVVPDNTGKMMMVMDDSKSDSQLEMSPKPLSRGRSFSDKFNRSAPMLFLKQHSNKLIGKETTSDDSRGDSTWTNWVVGLSCFCFLMPSMTIVALRAWNSVRPCIIFDCCYFVLVSICSFLSDYVYCWTETQGCVDFVWLDQWTATGGVVIVVLNILINPYCMVARVINIMGLLAAIYCIGKSRTASNKYMWRRWHCAWHLYSGIAISMLYIEEYLLRTGRFAMHDLWWPIR